VIRHCEQAEEEKRNRVMEKRSDGGLSPDSSAPALRDSIRLTAAETWEVTLAACKQVGRPIFFAMAIIVLAFVPVFALTGQEGKLFHPLAWTKTFAMVGATLLGVTLVPVLCSLLVRGPYHREDRNIVMRFFLKLYEPTLNWALGHRKAVIGGAAALLALAMLVAFGLPRSWVAGMRDAGWSRTANLVQGFGKEFMPPLNEGSLLYMPVLLPKTGLTELQRVMAWQDEVMASLPEVELVAGKLGRFETSTDPAPTEMLETTITLKPEWISTNRTVLGFIKLPRVMRNPD